MLSQKIIKNQMIDKGILSQHKCSNSYIIATWWCKPFIFQTFIIFDPTEFIVWNI